MKSTEFDNEKVVFLIGAGASVPIGIPAMKEMVNKYKKSINKSSSHFKVLEELKKAGVDSDLEEIMLAIERMEEFPKNGSFKAISLAGRSKLIFSDAGKKLLNNSIALRIDILVWIAEICLKFDRDIAENIWGTLVEILKSRCITIFTTNYDFAIEEIALDHDLIIVDNFKTGRHNRRFWDHSLESLNKPGLKVIKMHGSVDWYATKDGTEIEKNELSARTNREGIPVDRVAIFPTRFKDIYETHFFSLYKLFLNEIDFTKTLIVIGHSLRDEYIRAGIRESFRREDFRLVYIGPERPKALDDLKIGNKNPTDQIVFIKAYFEDISHTLAYVLQNHETAEIGKTLEEVTDFGREPKINFSERITNVEPGEKIEGELKVLAPAIPSAIIKAKLVYSQKKDSEPIQLDLSTSDGITPVTVEGIIESRQKILFSIPEEIIPGKYKLIFQAINEKQKILVEKEYVCKIGGESIIADQHDETGNESEPIDNGNEETTTVS